MCVCVWRSGVIYHCATVCVERGAWEKHIQVSHVLPSVYETCTCGSAKMIYDLAQSPGHRSCGSLRQCSTCFGIQDLTVVLHKTRADTILVTMDAKTLYTITKHKQGLGGLRCFLSDRSESEMPPSNFLLTSWLLLTFFCSRTKVLNIATVQKSRALSLVFPLVTLVQLSQLVAMTYDLVTPLSLIRCDINPFNLHVLVLH